MRRWRGTRRLIAFVIAALAITTSGERSHAADTARAQKYLDQGKALDNAGKFSDGLFELKNAVSSDPDFQPARYELGLHYLRTGFTKLAQVELETLRTQGFDDNKLVMPLMRIYLARGEYDAAIRKFDASKFSGNLQAAVLLMQARAQLGTGDLPAAQNLAAEGIKLAPHLPQALIASAMVARVEKWFADCEHDIDMGLIADPDNLELQVLKAEARTHAQDYESAAKLLDGAVRSYPGNIRARTARVFLNILRGNFGALREDVSAIARIDSKDPIGKYLRAFVMVREEHYKDAVNALQSIPGMLDRYAPARYVLAAAALGSNQQQTALLNAEIYLQKAPDDVSGLMLLAAAAEKSDDAPRAASTLEPLAQAYPKDNQLRIRLAGIYQSAGRRDDAEKLLSASLEGGGGNEAAVARALDRLRSGAPIGGAPEPKDLVQGKADLRAYDRFLGGQLFDEYAVAR